MLFKKIAVYPSKQLHTDCQVFISGQIFEMQFLNNSNDGFLEQLVPQSRGKKKENEQAIFYFSLRKSQFKKFLQFHHEEIIVKPSEFQYLQWKAPAEKQSMAVIQKRNCDEKKECHYSGIKIRHETIKILRLTVKNIFMQISN